MQPTESSSQNPSTVEQTPSTDFNYFQQPFGYYPYPPGVVGGSQPDTNQNVTVGGQNVPYQNYYNPYQNYQQQGNNFYQPYNNNYQNGGNWKKNNYQKKNNNRYNNKQKNFKGGRKKLIKEEIPEHIKSRVADITNMTTPEAINSYIEERKKKFPTKTNIETKEKEKQLRIERGELVDIPKTNQRNKRRRDNDENDGNKKRFKKICKYWRQGRCNSGENCKFIHDYVPSRPAIEEVLLRKLLSKDIEFENQAILQCTHFILSNNFLQPQT